MTTTDMITALGVRADQALAAAAEAEGKYHDLRTKVQESAWRLGWDHSIGYQMEDMLEELGLEGRPVRTEARARVRVTGTIHRLRDLTGLPELPGFERTTPVTVTQERIVYATVHLPRNTPLSNACDCDLLDEHADREQVKKALAGRVQGLDDAEILALRCSGSSCLHPERTELDRPVEPPVF